MSHVAHTAPEAWFWVRALRDFAPVTAGAGLLVGGLIGLVAGAPALGAAWGACILTGIPGVALAAERIRHSLGHLLRGDGLGPRPWEGVVFVASVLMPTAAVALGTAMAVGTAGAAFGGFAAAGVLALGGQLYVRLKYR